MSKRNCQYRIINPSGICLLLTIIFSLTFTVRTFSQIGRYWDQNLNSEAALLSGVVVAGEGGIAAIYYNPATISEMKKNNLSLSANLFSTYYFKAQNALGTDLPADRFQLNIYPRIITLTLKPKKNPDISIEVAYFSTANEYMQINKGISFTSDIIQTNPGNEIYTGEYYLRSKFEDYNGGAGFGYKLSEDFAIGFSGIISYKDDQYYNLITASASTPPDPGIADPGQYLADSRYHYKYNMFDVRLVTKAGLHYKHNDWSFGANINFPSVKIFGSGTVVRQYSYSNIHKVPGFPDGSDLFYSGRQSGCKAHFKTPLSISAGTNFYSPSGRSILLFTAEYFFGLSTYNYIEANSDPGEDGYNQTPFSPEGWLSLTGSNIPVFNGGIAFKQYVGSDLMISGGFRTDFRYTANDAEGLFPEYNRVTAYPMNVYHLNSGIMYNFKRGSIILGTQFSYGQDKNERQVVNLTEPAEYTGPNIQPLTGPINRNVTIRYADVSVYFGFLFNFMKEGQ